MSPRTSHRARTLLIVLDERPAVYELDESLDLAAFMRRRVTNDRHTLGRAFTQLAAALRDDPGRVPSTLEVEPLTAREREILQLFTAGVTYAEVGELLAISVNTVRQHVRGLYRKLNVSSKSEAVALALGAEPLS